MIWVKFFVSVCVFLERSLVNEIIIIPSSLKSEVNFVCFYFRILPCTSWIWDCCHEYVSTEQLNFQLYTFWILPFTTVLIMGLGGNSESGPWKLETARVCWNCLFYWVPPKYHIHIIQIGFKQNFLIYLVMLKYLIYIKKNIYVCKFECFNFNFIQLSMFRSCNIKMFKPIRLKVKPQIFYVGGLDVRKFPPHICISMKNWTLDFPYSKIGFPFFKD